MQENTQRHRVDPPQHKPPPVLLDYGCETEEPENFFDLRWWFFAFVITGGIVVVGRWLIWLTRD